MNRITAALSCTLVAALACSASAEHHALDRIAQQLASDTGAGRINTSGLYPSNRPDDPRRAQNGRLWIPRSPVGTRTPIRETVYISPGPAAFGAPADAMNDVLFVQPDHLLPTEIISPWANLDLPPNGPDRPGRQAARYAPSQIRDLRTAQLRYLADQGYILKVRTHVNPATLAAMSDAPPAPGAKPRAAAKEIEPRAVIRIKQRHAQPPEPQAAAPARQPIRVVQAD